MADVALATHGQNLHKGNSWKEKALVTIHGRVHHHGEATTADAKHGYYFPCKYTNEGSGKGNMQHRETWKHGVGIHTQHSEGHTTWNKV